ASGATLVDQTSNNLTITAANWGGTDTGATAEVDNFGTILKTGNSTTSAINVKFVNSGTVDVQSGVLAVAGPAAATETDTGAVYESTTGNGTIRFGGTTRTLDINSSITAKADFNGGTTTVQGTYNALATTVSGGTAHLLGVVSGLGPTTISSGLLDIGASSPTIGTLTQSGGKLTGTGTLTVTGTTALSGGVESGAGGLTIARGGGTLNNTTNGLDARHTLPLSRVWA